MAHTRQQEDRAQSRWVYKRQVLLDEPDLLLCQSDPLTGRGKAVDVVYVDFSKDLK